MKRLVLILVLVLGLAAIVYVFMQKTPATNDAGHAAGPATQKPAAQDGSTPLSNSGASTDARQTEGSAAKTPTMNPAKPPVALVPGKDGARPTAPPSDADHKHYVERQAAKVAFARESLAYALDVQGQSNPDIWFEKAIVPNVDKAKLNVVGAEKGAREALGGFAEAFRAKLKQLHGEHALDVPAKENEADLALFADEEVRMWQDLDAWLPEYNCEARLQQVLGPPMDGTVYLSAAHFQ